MKIKEIWTFIKTVLWPAAKPFICASREEAVELKNWIEAFGPYNGPTKEAIMKDDKVIPYPVFYDRIKEALENE